MVSKPLPLLGGTAGGNRCSECSGAVHNKDHHYVVLASGDVLHLRCYESRYYAEQTLLGGAHEEEPENYGGFWE